MRGTASGSSWLWMLLVLLGGAALSFADGDLECACRLRTQKGAMVNVTCPNVHNGSKELSCLKGERRPPTPPAPRYLRDGFMPLSGRSMVLFSRNGNTWQGARSACALVGADLLVPRDRDAMELLSRSPFSELFNDLEAFLGASDMVSEGNFVDIEGKPLDVRWRTYEPNNAGGNEDCLAWNRDGGVNDRGCEETLQYLCEWRLRAPPPPGYSLAAGAGTFLRLSEDRRPYEAAADACAADGAALFVPDTRDRVEALLRHVPVDSGDMLVDVNDRDDEGFFVTSTDERLSDLEFHDWLPGQPDDGGGGGAGEDCVALHSHGFLADVSCELPLRYVCEWLP
ncbi:macrophage mannose receptor 1-like [Schistocerca serialis cubense]|uniref:macrophage mannose receptor 1-like n=1 Tax=Schistocerca serialis cubense TaxID=2023355 RepID=UPI00214E68EB|nr:macrophage mannose receptor 1-like [Schistocerca serialis cubense]